MRIEKHELMARAAWFDDVTQINFAVGVLEESEVDDTIAPFTIVDIASVEGAIQRGEIVGWFMFRNVLYWANVSSVMSTRDVVKFIRVELIKTNVISMGVVKNEDG